MYRHPGFWACMDTQRDREQLEGLWASGKAPWKTWYHIQGSNKVKILITGNLGYIGPVLIRHLRNVFPKAKLVGYDTGYFAHCLTNAHEFPERHADIQLLGRHPRNRCRGSFRAWMPWCSLSAVSNDPMGNRFEAVTEAINYEATKKLAELAKRAGVKRFVFASSCSMYGFAEGGPRKETDELNPLTAYARSKVASEKALAPLAGDMVCTALRFSTACGMSERLRLDLVLNDFVACALAAGEITVLSDGTPWRPLIDVKDMARAIEWALIREPATTGGGFLAVNVGSDEWNYQVQRSRRGGGESDPRHERQHQHLGAAGQAILPRRFLPLPQARAAAPAAGEPPAGDQRTQGRAVRHALRRQEFPLVAVHAAEGARAPHHRRAPAVKICAGRPSGGFAPQHARHVHHTVVDSEVIPR